MNTSTIHEWLHAILIIVGQTCNLVVKELEATPVQPHHHMWYITVVTIDYIV